MKIIRRGNPNRVRKFKKECETCGTIFKFDETEIIKECWSVRPDPPESWIIRIVYCPVCNRKITIY